MVQQPRCAVCGVLVSAAGRLCAECSVPELCPMGCGRATDDVAGGPCTDCWDLVGQSGDPWDDD